MVRRDKGIFLGKCSIVLKNWYSVFENRCAVVTLSAVLFINYLMSVFCFIIVWKVRGLCGVHAAKGKRNDAFLRSLWQGCFIKGCFI